MIPSRGNRRWIRPGTLNKEPTMYRAALFAWAIIFVSASVASADVPLPKDIKYVDPRVSFEGIDKQADHVFYLRFLSFNGGPAGAPYTLIEVKDSKPFNLKAQRRLTDMSLLAMERKEFDKRKQDDASLKWLTDKTPGVLKASIATPATTASVNIKEVPVTAYRVTLKDGKLSAELVKEGKRSEAAPAGPLPVWGFGLVLAFAIAGLGIWFARRRSAQPEA
jgi:hypothetical protein